MVLRPLAALLVAAIIAAGCSSSAEKPSAVPQTSAPRSDTRSSTSTSTTSTTTPAATTTPPATAPGTGPVDALRAELVARGICEQVSTFVPLLPVTVTGLQNCEDGYLLITLPTQFERNAVIQKVADNPCALTTYLAIAETWVVLPDPATEARAIDVADILGGEVRAVPCERG